MKSGIGVATSLFVAGMVVGLLQLWFSPFSTAVFVKLELTLGALLAIALVISFVRRERRASAENRDGGRLDL